MSEECPRCGKCFETWLGLRIHIGAVHENDELLYTKLDCELCGSSFFVKNRYAEDRRFCGYDCSREWRRTTDSKGENHPGWKGGFDNFSYGPNWQEEREQALERDGYCCQTCGMTQSEHRRQHDQSLHVHHLSSIDHFHDDDYNADYEGMNRLPNLVSLCMRCHYRWEGIPVRPILVGK